MSLYNFEILQLKSKNHFLLNMMVVKRIFLSYCFLKLLNLKFKYDLFHLNDFLLKIAKKCFKILFFHHLFI